MSELNDIRELLALRKLTRDVKEYLHAILKQYLSVLSPLLKPQAVLGDYVQSASKEPAKNAEANFKEMKALFESLAASKTFNIGSDLEVPIQLFSTGLELHPFEYAHTATSGEVTKEVVVTSPLKWVLSYSGYGVADLRKLLTDRKRLEGDVRHFLLHTLALSTSISKQKNLAQLCKALYFPVSIIHMPDLEHLPLVCISSSLSTIRPADHIIIESTELSGKNVFEEVVNIEEVRQLRSEVKERLLEIIHLHGG